MTSYLGEVREQRPESTEPAVAPVQERDGEQVVPLRSVSDPRERIPDPTADPPGTTEVSPAASTDTSADTAEDGVPGEVSVDVREQARTVWRDTVAAGQPLTGLELGRLFGRSERWGRARIAEMRHDDTSTGAGTSATTVPARRRRTRAGTAGNGDGRAVAGTPATRHDSAGTPPHSVPVSATNDRDGHRPAAGAARPSGVSAVPVVPAASVVPGGARLVAWAGFLFGTVISVAANVLYAWLPTLTHQAPAPGLAPQVGAAVWPIALVISVEVLSRVPWGPGWTWRLARYGGAGVVAAGAAVISYGHLNGVLAAWGYGTIGAAVGPLVVDGLMTISGFALLAMSGHGTPAADGKAVAA